MAKYSFGDRVIFHDDKKIKHRGRVTKTIPKEKKVKVVTDEGKRFTIPTKRLKYSPDRVLILEGRLDKRLTSKRIYGPMFQQLLYSYNTTALYERVHSIVDLKNFIKQEGRKVETRIIHIMCHGENAPQKNTAYLRLTHEKLDLNQNLNIFEGLNGKVLIFSCCEIGNNLNIMQAIKDVSNAIAVIGYRKEVYDTFTNIAEILLYDRLIETINSPSNVVNQIQIVLKELKIEACEEKVIKPVLVCV